MALAYDFNCGCEQSGSEAVLVAQACARLTYPRGRPGRRDRAGLETATVPLFLRVRINRAGSEQSCHPGGEVASVGGPISLDRHGTSISSLIQFSRPRARSARVCA